MDDGPRRQEPRCKPAWPILWDQRELPRHCAPARSTAGREIPAQPQISYSCIPDRHTFCRFQRRWHKRATGHRMRFAPRWQYIVGGLHLSGVDVGALGSHIRLHTGSTTGAPAPSRNRRVVCLRMRPLDRDFFDRPPFCECAGISAKVWPVFGRCRFQGHHKASRTAR